MATPLIRVMNGHIYRVSNRRKRKPELKPSEIPTLLGYTADVIQLCRRQESPADPLQRYPLA
ncbi:hypothetical protein AB687_003921 [Escherichia coli]|nr:hypothetical protein [Escherichia coli]EFL4414210.1 hypothetical protein [Escherichia coli]EFL9614522.1 hypothetical protein [Escherichia coli]EHJ8005962.1 hypothetical protein [Escherichia coli]HBA8345883.1 hypothetical protein [Escherichia coli]